MTFRAKGMNRLGIPLKETIEYGWGSFQSNFSWNSNAIFLLGGSFQFSFPAENQQAFGKPGAGKTSDRIRQKRRWDSRCVRKASIAGSVVPTFWGTL